MEVAASRVRPVRLFIIPIVVAALLFGWLAYAHHEGRAPVPPHKLSLGDFVLMASTAKSGISMEYDGITTPPGPNHSGHIALNSMQWGVGRAIGARTPTAVASRARRTSARSP